MRDEKENKIDNYFRDGLENLNIFPPADVWDNIADKIPSKKGNRKVFLWIAVAASVSLFAAISGWNYLQKTKNNQIDSIHKIATNKEIQQKHIHNKSQVDSGINSDSNALMPKEKSRTYTLKENKSIKENIQTEKNEAIPQEKAAFANEASIKNPKQPYSNTSGITKKLEEEAPQYEKAIAQELKEKSTNKTFPEANQFTGETTSANVATEVNKENHYASFFNAIQLNRFKTPDVYGKISDGSSVAKIDTVKVYDNLFAYEDVSENKEKVNRWAIGGQMAPLYSYRNISEVNSPDFSKSSMNKIEKGIITYSTGVLVDYEAGSRLSLHTGIYYMKMGQEIENVSNFSKKAAKSGDKLEYMASNSSRLAPAMANSTGTIVTSATNLYYEGSVTSDLQSYAPGNLALSPAANEKKNIEQSFEFIEVPFLAKYKIINRKINLHLLGGVSTHVLVNNKTTIETDGQVSSNGKTTDIETMNYSSSVGFGVGYRLRKNVLFSIEPTFKYYLNSFNSSDAVKLHPYAFGLYSGLSFKF